jgi:hypothetical protein
VDSLPSIWGGVDSGGFRYLELGKTCFGPLFLVIIHTPLHSGNCDLNTK